MATPQRSQRNSALKGVARPRGTQSLRVVILCAIISLVCCTLSARELPTGQGPFSVVRGIVQTICMPVRFVGAAVSAPFQGLGNIAANLTADEASLSELKAENERLQAENAELKESDQTATRLQKLLDLKNTYDLKSTGARIVASSTDAGSVTVTIDKGTSSGIAIGMPVTDAYGVIGQVAEVGPTTATVRLITDERSGVAAMVQSSRAQGQLVGQGDGTLRLTLVRTDQAVKTGDLVVTSGLGGVYPKGLPLGTVTSVERPSGALYYTIQVRPLATTSSFEEVLVITSLTDDQKADASVAQEADAQEAGQAPSRTEEGNSTDGSGSTDGDSTTDQGDSGSSGDSGDSQSSGGRTTGGTVGADD